MAPSQVELMVYFDDADPAGIVFFANYLRLSERALETILINEGIPWTDWFDHPEWGAPLRHVEAEYMNPLRPGQKCVIQQGVLRLGDSSVALQSEIYSHENQLCARVVTTHVFVDKVKLKKRPIPDHLRNFLKAKLLS
ncbi:MAG: acyl-CoA thioesterase [Bdellovibrionales bacterium]|nr:acyl-CoA thioesterase [Bdellovibrionales bacterium]